MNFHASDFLGLLNQHRAAHVTREHLAYYGEAPEDHETLVALNRGKHWVAVCRTALRPQYHRQAPLSNGRFVCGDEFFIDTRNGEIYIDSNGKLLQRGHVTDALYWQKAWRPHGTLDKPRPVEPYALCEFRKQERLKRVAKMKPYEF